MEVKSVFELGTIVGKYVQEIPRELLTTSVPGKCYHIRIETVGIADEQQVADTLIQEFLTKFKAEVKYIRIENGVVDIQLEGSPFVWSAVILWLPSIFTLLGITLIGIAVFTVFAAIPGWAWGVLAIGIVFILLAPSASKIIAR